MTMIKNKKKVIKNNSHKKVKKTMRIIINLKKQNKNDLFEEKFNIFIKINL